MFDAGPGDKSRMDLDFISTLPPLIVIRRWFRALLFREHLAL